MSYEWGRVTLTARCAYCGAPMRDGDAALFVTIENERYSVKKPFTYCVACKGPAPPDLAPAGPRQARTKKFTSVFGVGAKIRADLERRIGKPMVNREPGEDG